MKVFVLSMLMLGSTLIFSQASNSHTNQFFNIHLADDSLSIRKWDRLQELYEYLGDSSLAKLKLSDSLIIRIGIIPPQESTKTPAIITLRVANKNLEITSNRSYFPSDKLTNYNLDSLSFGERRLLRKSYRKEFLWNQKLWQIKSKSGIPDSIKLRRSVRSIQLGNHQIVASLKSTLSLKRIPTLLQSYEVKDAPNTNWIIELVDSIGYKLVLRKGAMEETLAQYVNQILELSDSLGLIDQQEHHFPRTINPYWDLISNKYLIQGQMEASDSTYQLIGGISFFEKGGNYMNQAIDNSLFIIDNKAFGEQRTYNKQGKLIAHWVAKEDSIFGNFLKGDRLVKLAVLTSGKDFAWEWVLERELTFYKSGDIRSKKVRFGKRIYYKRNGKEKLSPWDYTLVQYVYAPSISLILSQILINSFD